MSESRLAPTAESKPTVAEIEAVRDEYQRKVAENLAAPELNQNVGLRHDYERMVGICGLALQSARSARADWRVA